MIMRFFKKKDKEEAKTPSVIEELPQPIAPETLLSDEPTPEPAVQAEEPVVASVIKPKKEKPATAPVIEEPKAEEPAKGWFQRLRDGLNKTSSKLSDGIADIFTKRKLDDAMVEELEELLIQSDMGAKVATRIAAEFAKGKFDREIAPEDVKAELAARVAEILEPVARPLDIDAKAKPHVVLVVGVNGNGKTTTIGKMANLLKNGGWSVMLAAGDTFRAAAVEQLQVWGERTGCPVVTGADQADAASLAYQAYERAKKEGVDVLLVDTAGRLHNKNNLMAELQKIRKVLQKLEDKAPHSVILVLDATTGQNALAQVEAFKSMVDVTGLVVTKLDGTAKGGVVVALAEKFGLPIHAIGVGESVQDLRDFSAQDFARNLLG